MRVFDTKVQELKHQVLTEIVRMFQADELANGYYEIPRKIIPGPRATMRCCIYRERAIVEERVKLAMGGDSANKNVVEVLDSACDECPVIRFSVTDACRGCIAHKCNMACPAGAISFEKLKAVIDPEKCLECGKCMQACPYNAIIESQRPCVKGCTSNAITINAQKKAVIDNDKCTNCGNCVCQCPFGAIVDKSFILDILKILRESQGNGAYRVYAIVAPSVASQFTHARVGQIAAGIRRAGFYRVVEAALGADIVAQKDARELVEKGFLASSCCPAFVRYIRINFPQLAAHISRNASPMVETARLVRQADPQARVVFIGPCIAKKLEARLPETEGNVDSVMTFEELQALFDGMAIDVETLPEETLDDASGFGRGFARSGGVAAAVQRAIEEEKLDISLKPELCSGAAQYKIALLKASKGRLESNFIEGMACEGGCIGGAACINHISRGAKGAAGIDAHSKEAGRKSISASVEQTPAFLGGQKGPSNTNS